MKRFVEDKWMVKNYLANELRDVKSVLEPGYFEKFDPFLFLVDEIFGHGAFEEHPHRGMETVSFVLEGELTHYDNATGNGGTLKPGELQYLTAGKGVIHNETVEPNEKVHLLQLWVNLPAENKMAEPRYQQLSVETVPKFIDKDVEVRVYIGQFNGVQSPFEQYASFDFLDVYMEKDSSLNYELPGNYNTFLYFLEGSAVVGENNVEIKKDEVAHLNITESVETTLTMLAKETSRIIILAGKPLDEPIVAHGPFVMNSKEEIMQAYVDFQSGKFLY